MSLKNRKTVSLAGLFLAAVLGSGIMAGLPDNAFAGPLTPAQTPSYNTVSSQTQTDKALMAAVKNNDVRGVAASLKAGANPDATVNKTDNVTALMMASYNGNKAIVSLLLQNGATINAQNTYDGATSLMWVAAQGHDEVARLLLAAGADANIVNQSGETALMMAVYGESVSIVRDLLDSTDIDINRQNPVGLSALMVAAYQGHDGIAKALMAKDSVQLDLRDQYGWTALMWASYEGNGSIVEALLKQGADATLKNNRAQTARSLALESGYKDIAVTLGQYEQRQNVIKNETKHAIRIKLHERRPSV